jgi:hypothetical protein
MLGMLVKMSNRWHRSSLHSVLRRQSIFDLAQPLSELTLDEGRDGDGPAVEGCDAVPDERVVALTSSLKASTEQSGRAVRL